LRGQTRPAQAQDVGLGGQRHRAIAGLAQGSPFSSC
jgi:hypothetical protein